MKRSLFLCAAISAALVLVGCANQNSDATTQAAAQRGALYGVSGSGAGGGGTGPNTNAIHNIP